jgi:hypothetical protein
MILKSYNPYDTVKLCKNNLCIEAKGENGRMLIVAVCIALVLMAIAAIANAMK